VQLKNTFGAVVLLTVLIGAPCGAQSTAVAAPDSAVAGRADSARTDSAAVAPGNSAVAPGAPRDSLARPGADTVPAPANPAPSAAPVDSILGAACQETADGSPDLWLVTFLPTATESDRTAVAKGVGGTLLGMSRDGGPGSWYLQVPGSGGDPTVADRLILFPAVLEVGSTRCPS